MRKHLIGWGAHGYRVRVHDQYGQKHGRKAGGHGSEQKMRAYILIYKLEYKEEKKKNWQ